MINKDFAIKKLAENIWEYGETPKDSQWLVVTPEFNPDDLDVDKALGKYVCYQLKWIEKGKIVEVVVHNMDGYGASEIKKTNKHQIKI